MAQAPDINPQLSYNYGSAQNTPPWEQQVGPPRDEAEMQQRVSGWQRFFEKLATDPNLRDSLMSFGATALQPRMGGQTQMGQFGKATMAGLETYRAGQDRDIARKAQEARTGLVREQTRLTGSNANVAEATEGDQIEAVKAELEAAKQKPEHMRAVIGLLQGQTKLYSDERMQAQLQNLQQQARALMIDNKFRSDPAYREMKLDELWNQIESLGANTQFTRARTRALEEQLASGAFTGPDAAGQPASAVQLLEYRVNTLKQKYPGLSDSEARDKAWRETNLNFDPVQYEKVLNDKYALEMIMAGGDPAKQAAIRAKMGEEMDAMYRRAMDVFGPPQGYKPETGTGATSATTEESPEFQAKKREAEERLGRKLTEDEIAYLKARM
jgi:hypothetical protein